MDKEYVAVIKKKGQILGAPAFCLEDTEALVIPSKEFLASLESKPEGGLKVMRKAGKDG